MMQIIPGKLFRHLQALVCTEYTYANPSEVRGSSVCISEARIYFNVCKENPTLSSISLRNLDFSTGVGAGQWLHHYIDLVIIRGRSSVNIGYLVLRATVIDAEQLHC